MTDIWLRITGTRKQAIDAFKTLGMDKEMLRRNEDGTFELVGFSHHVAVIFHKNLMTQYSTYAPGAAPEDPPVTPPVFSGPHLMIRFVSKAAKRKAREKIIEAGGLPVGLERVDPAVLFPDGPTIVWAGD